MQPDSGTPKLEIKTLIKLNVSIHRCFCYHIKNMLKNMLDKHTIKTKCPLLFDDAK